MIKKIIYKIIYLLFNKIYRIKVEGIENIPKNESVIITPNHKSNIDAILLLNYLKYDTSYIAKKEIQKIPLVANFIINYFNLILVDRSKNDIDATKKMYKALDENKKIVIFPEGTRLGLVKGKKLKSGVIKLAIKKNVKVIPVGISGKLKPFGKNNFIRFGTPLDFNKLLEDEKQKEINMKNKTKNKTLKNKEITDNSIININLTNILTTSILDLIDNTDKDYIKLKNR